MRSLLLLLVTIVSLRGEILDRIAVVVGDTVITETQIDEELRVTALLNSEPVSLTAVARKAAADRLIEQELVRREILVTHYPPPSTADVNRMYQTTEAALGGAAAMHAAMTSYHVTESVLRAHLILQLTLLRFVDQRFRANVSISDQDVRSYYEKEAAKWRTSHPNAAPPTLEVSRATIEKAISGERADAVLSNWIQQSRREVRIRYLDGSLETK